MTAPVRLAVLGDPLRYTLSPVLHRAGAEALGFACESQAICTPLEALPATLARLAAAGYTGCNLTMPLKEAALACMTRSSAAATRARSVNTVTFAGGEAYGETTDGTGFVDLLAELECTLASARTVLLGAGGAARSLALALADAGAPPPRVVSRRDPGAGAAWGAGDHWCAWGSPAAESALAAADVVVNCTPVAGGDTPVPIDRLHAHALVIDLNYGESPTAWVLAARAHGLRAVDGLGLLVHQARHSLALWFGRDVSRNVLARAVGWPR